MYPQSLAKLIEDFKKLPGVGERTAERYALRMLETDREEVELFAADLLGMKERIKRCPTCGNFTEGALCDICSAKDRDQTVICVVQEAKDIFALDKTGYNGLYHVLNGAISPAKGILPEDINIVSLLPRINPEVKEVIIATNPTLDGETTALYLTKILKDTKVTVTRLAHGLPMGGNLDYADDLTLIKAMEGRQKQ